MAGKEVAQDMDGRIERVQTADTAELDKSELKGVDEALIFTMTHGPIEWAMAEEAALVRKIDRRLLPLMFISALLLFMETQIFGNAAILGMVEDLGLYTLISLEPLTISLTRYSWTASIGYFAVLLFQYPMLLAAQRLRIGKLTGILLLYAGALCFMMLVVNNFTGVMILRFFYGIQGTATPLSIIITPMWWTASEQPLRVAVWFSGSGFGTLVGQAIDFGIAQITTGKYGAEPWRWMYVILPSFTVVFALIYLLLFPDSPVKCRFLNEREKAIAIYRLEKNNTGIKARAFKRSQVVSCLRDPTFYVVCLNLFTFAFITNALGSFATFIVESFGYTGFEIVKQLIPTSLVAFVCMLGSGLLNKKIEGYRILVSVCFTIPSMIALVLLWRLPRDNIAGLKGGLNCLPIFYGAFAQFYGLMASNIAGHTKKTVINAAGFICSAAGGIAGPFAFKGSEAAKGYPSGMIACLCLLATVCVSYIAIYFYYISFNRKQEAHQAEAEIRGETQDSVAFLDLLEIENPFFRYSV